LQFISNFNSLKVVNGLLKQATANYYS